MSRHYQNDYEVKEIKYNTLETTNSYLLLNFETMHEIKLIIGNGFDLACGLNSSYSAFFKKDEERHVRLLKWMENTDAVKPDNCTAWDLIFAWLGDTYSSFADPGTVDWKDVENVMKLSLGFRIKNVKPVDFNLNKVSDCFRGIFDYSDLNDFEKAMYAYASSSVSSKNISFYRYLYEDLLSFEKRFSDFLSEQMNEEKYIKATRRLLTKADPKLFNFQERMLVSVDSFNYTTPDVFLKGGELERINLRHINGKIGGAIFGIDSQDIPLDDERYIFTKTHRKMIALASGGREEFHRGFQNVVVYGHSLSEADYSYFFPILDKLNLDHYNEYNSRFILAFSDYKNNREECEKEAAWALLKLIDAYDRWKNPQSPRHGLADLLIASDRIGFAFIDTSTLLDD